MTVNEPPAEPAQTLAQFAQKVFIENHQSIIAQEPAARDGDVEGIHDMRVAIRRLRVALSNFEVCLPRKDRRRLRDELGHLADALGRVRDLDVMIATMELNRPIRPAGDNRAIDSFIKRLQRLRRRQHRLLIVYLDGEEFANFKREFSTSEVSRIDEQEEHGQAA